MSNLKVNNIQLGFDATPANNSYWRQFGLADFRLTVGTPSSSGADMIKATPTAVTLIGPTAVAAPAQSDSSLKLATTGNVVAATQGASTVIGATSGTANAIVGSFSPAVTALSNGMFLFVRASAISTITNPTFQADATAAKTIVKGNNLPLAPGDISGASHWLEFQYDGILDVFILQNPAKSITPAAQIQSVSAPTFAANAMTIPATFFTLDFRSVTPGSGSATTVSGTSAALVVPAGATLGTANNVQSDLYVLELNNAGVIEHAITNGSGNINLSETGLISTTAISNTSNSASIVYSTTARTNVNYRVVQLIRSTQTTAGQWAISPTLIQGAGGLAFNNLSTFGQTPVLDVTASRSFNTTYYNTTNRARLIVVQGANIATSGGFGWTISIVTPTGASLPFYSYGTANPAGPGNSFASLTVVVPPGWSYAVATSGTQSIAWYEN